MTFLKKAIKFIGHNSQFNKAIRENLEIIQKNNGDGLDDQTRTILDNTVIIDQRVKNLEAKIKNCEFEIVEQLR